MQVRAAGISGQGPVQDLSLFPVELFPFFLMDHQLYFADVRAFPTVDGTFGGNVGLGYRIYNPSLDRVFGISGWYDADGTRDPYFQQFGVSLETYGRWWDWRANVYVPFGQTFDQTSLGAIGNSARFVGNNVVYNELQGYISAMTGFDMELGVPIPGKFAERTTCGFTAAATTTRTARAITSLAAPPGCRQICTRASTAACR